MSPIWLQQSAFSASSARRRGRDGPAAVDAAAVSTSSSDSVVPRWLPTVLVPVLSMNVMPDSVDAAFSCVVCSSWVAATARGA